MKWFVAVSLPLLCAYHAAAQHDIALGEWRMHLSYNTIRHVEVSSHSILAAGNNAVLVYDRAEQSLRTFNKLNGLSGTNISALAFDDERNQLVVGYNDGSLDIIHEFTVAQFSRIRDADVTTSRTINHVSVQGPLAYLSTPFGVVLFDLTQLEIKETWRDLGSAGETLQVFGTAFLNDSIYMATDDGVIAGNINDNLLDFNNWIRYNTQSLSGSIRSIVSFDNRIYVAGTEGLYRFDGSHWVLEHTQENGIESLSASQENLFIIEGGRIVQFDRTGASSVISDALLNAPSDVKQDEDGNLWIGDLSAGLISNKGGAFSAYLPNGPTADGARKLVYNDGKIFVAAGGYTESGQPLNLPGNLNIFENGAWRVASLPALDLTDISVNSGTMSIGSFGDGLLVLDASGNISIFDETNSPLTHPQAGESRVAALSHSANGLWVATYGGSQSLHLRKTDGSWESFDLDHPNAAQPTQLLIDKEGHVWAAFNPETGGGLVVFDPTQNQELARGTPAGSGALPNGKVNALALDLDGYVWVGTDAGLAYFFSETQDAIKPIYENRFLLRDEKITSLAIDGGNRKWVGTKQGAWLFDPTGEALVHHFTVDNSPLPSNDIQDIEIHPVTGEVFFATDQGIVSYRSDATEAGNAFENPVKIFPNPVSPGYSGTVGIYGLARDAVVRITSVSGKLIWQTQAHGGTATWNVRDHHGQRVATGIYLVFASALDGSESVVGKVAVIE